jgi:HlyD family secretion protein
MNTKSIWARAGALAIAAILAGCNERPPSYQGWIEANLIFVGPDEAGRVEELSVREGDHVDKGAPLFRVDADLQQADVDSIKANLLNAHQTFDRAQSLLKSGSGTQKDFDAAQSVLRNTEALLNSSQTRLARRRVVSPVTGNVQQVYFRPGEVVSAGRPIVSLLPPENLKARFYVPETVLASITYGDVVTVHCDGCADDFKARVSFISGSAEFTPPVIYSLEERSKLVYLIEALPDDPDKLRVGQPIDVTLNPGREAKR